MAAIRISSLNIGRAHSGAPHHRNVWCIGTVGLSGQKPGFPHDAAPPPHHITGERASRFPVRPESRSVAMRQGRHSSQSYPPSRAWNYLAADLEPAGGVRVDGAGRNLIGRYPMLTKWLAAAVVGSALIAAPALAQTTNQSGASNAPKAQLASATGLWQGSKLIGMNVYNPQNEKIGDIKELMADKSGKIDTVVI